MSVSGTNSAGGEPRVASPSAAESRQQSDEVVRQALRDKTERIPLRALEKRGFRTVQVLDMTTIERIVHEAVESSLKARHASLTGPEVAALEKDAKHEFLRLLADHKKVVAQKSEVERAREDLARQVDTLREELDKQQGALKAERDRGLGGEMFSLSPESFTEMESKIRRLFGQLMQQEKRVTLVEAGPEALRGLNRLERDLVALIDRVMGEERDKLLGRERKLHGEKVDVLERRIEKLNRALSDTESVLLKVMAAKSLDPGIASIYDTVQGLALDALNFDKKKELLKVVFEENVLIQKGLADSPRPASAIPDIAPPADFGAPVEAMTKETAY